MATLYKEKNSTYRIQFFDGNGNRPSIRLGKVPKKTAETFLSRVEEMIHCRLAGQSPSSETSSWLGGLPNDTLAKLSQAGFEVQERHTTGELWAAFLKQKNDVKDSTLKCYDCAEQRFFAFFNRKTDLRKLTPTQFEEWKTFLRTKYRSSPTDKPLAEATVAGTLTKAKAVFNWSVSVGWIDESPLDGVGRGSFVNREKDRFVTPEEYRRLLDVCPCQEWRVIIALARIGGLRCPSELLRLRWADVNWEQSRFYVTSSKTERHKGKEGRLVPLFSELRIELERLFKTASTAGKEFVINRYRDPERTNLGTQFARIVEVARVQPILRPFDNMRASRSTEVYAEFGAFLESQWIGHSSKIAKDHYLQVREEDFERAAGRPGIGVVHFSQEAVHFEKGPVQNPVLQASATTGTGQQGQNDDLPASPLIAIVCETVQPNARKKEGGQNDPQVPKRGAEHPFDFKDIS